MSLSCVPWLWDGGAAAAPGAAAVSSSARATVVPASALKEEKDLFALLDKKAALSSSIKTYKVHGHTPVQRVERENTHSIYWCLSKG